MIDTTQTKASTNPVANTMTTASGTVNTITNPTQTGTTKPIASLTPFSTLYTSGANQSTTTLSTANAQKKIPGIQNQIDNNSKTGVTTTNDASGNPVSTYADGSVYNPQETKKEADVQKTISEKGGYYGDTYVAPGAEAPKDVNGNAVTLTEYSPTQKQGIDDLNAIRTRANANSAALIGQIQAQYENLIQDQQLANKAANAGTTAYAIGGGRGVVSSDAVVQGQVSYGIQQIKKLVDAENMAITQAQIAADKQDWEMASKINDNIQAIKTKQQEVITKMNEKIIAEQDKLKLQKEQVEKEQTITDLYNQGITDPNAIMAKLKAAGNTTITAKEIGDTVALVSGVGGTGDIGDYNLYKSQTLQKGLVPMDYLTFKDKQAEKAAKADYAKAYNTAAGKAAAEKLYGVGTEGDSPLYTGMKPITATAVRSKVTKFGSEPMVTNFSTIQDGYNFAKSLDTKTINPADDQALIYSLAKALDPGSVVREGEYATAQKYAQSWVNAYGKAVTQALAGTGFLSETARENIKKTIEQKYNTTKKSYDNLYNQYSESINKITGSTNGEDFLIDYANPQVSPEEESRNQVNNYITSNPADAETIAKMYEVPGATDQDIFEYLKANGNIK